MESREEKLRYIIEVDTSSAEATIRKNLGEKFGINEKGAGTPSKGGGDSTAEAVNNVFDLLDTTIVPYMEEATGAIIDAINALKNEVVAAMKGIETPEVPRDIADVPESLLPSEEKAEQRETLDSVMSAMKSRLFAASLGGFAMASQTGNVGAQAGFAGAAIGGAPGAGVAAVGGLLQGVVEVTKSLEYFNGTIFEASTGFDMAMMGLKFEIANELAPLIQELMPVIVDLISSLAELAVEVAKLITPLLHLLAQALIPIIDWLVVFAKAIEAAVNALKLIVDVKMKESEKAELLAGIKGDRFNTASADWGVKNLPGFLDFTNPSYALGARARFAHEENVANIEKSFSEGGITQEQHDQQLKAANEHFEAKKKELLGFDFDNPDLEVNQAIIDANKNMEGSLNELDKAFKDAIKSTMDFVNGLDDSKKRQEELMEKGRKLNLALFNSMDAWAHTLKDHGTQVVRQGFERAKVPVPLSERSPAEQFIVNENAGHAADPRLPGSRGFPKATPAAVQFKVTDRVEIKAQDEDRLHLELLSFKNEVLSKLHGLQDGRLQQLALARKMVFMR